MNDTSTLIIKPEVDYEKSINKQRLVYKADGFQIFNIIIDSIAFLIFFGMFSIPIILLIKGVDIPFSAVMICTVIIAWMISNVWLNNSLVKIEGKSVDKKQDILLTMDEFFSSYDFKINNERMMRSFKPSYQPIWGRIITILFDGDIMYLNITSLGKSDSQH